MKQIEIEAKLDGATVELELSPEQRKEFIQCLEREGKFSLKLEKVTEMSPGGAKVSSVVVD